jgi:hypothetical protein
VDAACTRSKPSAAKSNLVDEDADHPDRALLVHVVIEAAGQERWLPPIFALDETAHPRPSDTAISEA